MSYLNALDNWRIENVETSAYSIGNKLLWFLYKLLNEASLNIVQDNAVFAWLLNASHLRKKINIENDEYEIEE